jgi:DnaJ-class molecular chaperone
MEFKDYYATLGVTKSSSAKEIKQAFRKLARKHHPDVNPGDKTAEMKFKDINEAYEVLGDAEKRRKYDELGANWRMYEQAQQQGSGSPGNPFDGFNVHFGGRAPGGAPGSGYRTMTPEEMEQLFGDQNPFSDFFTTFFGGGGLGGEEPGTRPGGARGRTGGRARHRQGRDVEHELELTLEDAYHGTTRRLALKQDGHSRTVDVRIPAGVGDGSRVRVAGEGEQGSGGATSGDLYLRVRLQPHPIFERKGRDLYVKVPLPVTTMVLGGEVEVPTISGKTVRLRIPPLTQNNQMFRLKGYGMPSVGKPNETGDAYARVEAQMPTHLPSEEREHYEALARLSGGAKKHTAA